MLPLPGRFQADNALMAAALAAVLGERDVLDRLGSLRGVRGRLELAARLPNGAAVYVDYAHTPDALERLLTALRPHTTGRLHVVFGAGGDRDRGKRPLMGAAAARLADVAIVTDDNPRSEDPAAIRAAVLGGVPRRTRGRRSGARDRRGTEWSRGRRRAGGGGQGPRAGADDRRHGDPVRRRGCRAAAGGAVMSWSGYGGWAPSPQPPPARGGGVAVSDTTALPLPLREGVGGRGPSRIRSLRRPGSTP